VGGDDDFPIISGLSVLDTEPPLWFVDVNDTRLELTTDELQNYRLFHRACMERLCVCFRMMKTTDWLMVVSQAMKNAVKIETAAEVSYKGQFYELLEEFVTDRHKAMTREEILLGRPWHDPKIGRHYFRLKDLTRYLERANFRVYSPGQVTQRLRDLGGDKGFFNLKGIGVNVWYVPDKFVPMPSIELPDVEEEPI
jgi:hypothetical protein